MQALQNFQCLQGSSKQLRGFSIQISQVMAAAGSSASTTVVGVATGSGFLGVSLSPRSKGKRELVLVCQRHWAGTDSSCWYGNAGMAYAGKQT